MRYACMTGFLIATLALSLSPVPSQAAATPHRHRLGVVVQVSNDNPEAWDFTLLNISYIQAQLGKNRLPIEVVAFGPGIFMLTRNSVVRERLGKAMKNGVRFVACEDSMQAHKLAREDMYPGITFVPLGIAEIVSKQRQGWSYLKP